MTHFSTDIEAPMADTIPMPVSAFDDVAAAYDSLESQNHILAWMRSRVHQLAIETFEHASRLLEIGCGTGTDALFFARRGHHIVATDPSDRMLAATKEKFALAGLTHRVECRQSGAEELNTLIEDYGYASFDGIFSNFGALNCIADLRPFAPAAAALLRPHGKILLNLMPPICPWEILYYVFKLRPSDAFRRWRGRTGTSGLPVQVGNRHVQTFYHSTAVVRHHLSNRFQLKRQIALGVLVPPPYLQRIARRQRLFEMLCRADTLVAGLPLIRNSGDHVVMIFEKTQDAKT